MLHLKKFLAKKLSLKDHKDVSDGLLCYLRWVQVSIGLWTVIFPRYLRLNWENDRHFATPAMVSPQNDFWGRSPEIPCWWRVTTQILVVFLIVRAAREIWSANQKHYPDLDSVTSSVWHFLKSLISKCFSFPPTSKTPANQEKVLKWLLGGFISWHHCLSSSFIVLKTIVMVSVHG